MSVDEDWVGQGRAAQVSAGESVMLRPEESRRDELRGGESVMLRPA
jgi:hypothetical protein